MPFSVWIYFFRLSFSSIPLNANQLNVTYCTRRDGEMWSKVSVETENESTIISNNIDVKLKETDIKITEFASIFFFIISFVNSIGLDLFVN